MSSQGKFGNKVVKLLSGPKAVPPHDTVALQPPEKLALPVAVAAIFKLASAELESSQS